MRERNGFGLWGFLSFYFCLQAPGPGVSFEVSSGREARTGSRSQSLSWVVRMEWVLLMRRIEKKVPLPKGRSEFARHEWFGQLLRQLRSGEGRRPGSVCGSRMKQNVAHLPASSSRSRTVQGAVAVSNYLRSRQRAGFLREWNTPKILMSDFSISKKIAKGNRLTTARRILL